MEQKPTSPPIDGLLKWVVIFSWFSTLISLLILGWLAYEIYHYDLLHFMDQLQIFLKCPKK